MSLDFARKLQRDTVRKWPQHGGPGQRAQRVVGSCKCGLRTLPCIYQTRGKGELHYLTDITTDQ